MQDLPGPGLPGRSSGWTLEEGTVDAAAPHFIIRYGPDPDNWLPDIVALVGRKGKRGIVVQFLLPEEPGNKERADMLASVRHDIDFFCRKLYNPNPWDYLVYHCNTASNLYGSVHWGYCPKGRPAPTGK